MPAPLAHGLWQVVLPSDWVATQQTVAGQLQQPLLAAAAQDSLRTLLIERGGEHGQAGQSALLIRGNGPQHQGNLLPILQEGAAAAAATAATSHWCQLGPHLLQKGSECIM